MAKKSGLGKGLDALFLDNETAEGSSLMTLRISDIEPNKDQPRKTFEQEALTELAESIREHGILQPVVVRGMPGGVYQIIAGERRWRAGRMAGLAEIPAIVIEADDDKVRELALIENLQRQDLTPLEEAEGYRSLMQHGMTQEEVAARLGKSRPVVANALRLLNLPDAVKKLLEDGSLTVGHARLLAGLPQEEAVQRANDVLLHGMNVRQLEAALKKDRAAAKRTAEQKPAPAADSPWGDKELREMQLALQEELGRRVVISRRGEGGTLTIEYSDRDDLTALVDKLLEGD